LEGKIKIVKPEREAVLLSGGRYEGIGFGEAGELTWGRTRQRSASIKSSISDN
jgi:hypothetical protein